MIALLSGKVVQIDGSAVTVDVNGVGYEVFCSRLCLEKLEIGARAQIVVQTEVREDSIRLYGFDDQLEKQVFNLLLQVKGVGTRSASDIISNIEKRDLLRMIAAGDSAALQLVRGIGKKTAERIIVELRDKVAEYALTAPGRAGLGGGVPAPAGEAVQALLALGFARREAETALHKAQEALGSSPAANETAGLVKEALKYF